MQSLCCLWECHLYSEDLKIWIRERKIPILSYFPIFTAPYLKRYLRYAYETFRYYRKFTRVCISQISDLYLFFCVRYRVSKLGFRCAKHPSKEYLAIFTTLYLKRYLRYDNETFRDYRRATCLCITQISDLYVLFYVRYRISKLGSRSTKPQFWAVFTILKCCVFILRHKYTSISLFTLVEHIERYKKKVERKKLPPADAGNLAPKMLHFSHFLNLAFLEHL